MSQPVSSSTQMRRPSGLRLLCCVKLNGQSKRGLRFASHSVFGPGFAQIEVELVEHRPDDEAWPCVDAHVASSSSLLADASATKNEDLSSPCAVLAMYM